MLNYTLRRLALGVITFIGVTIIVFVVSRLSGDVVYLLLPQDATEQEITQLRTELGLDQPIPVQYLRFAEGVMSGDFGQSIRYRRPAMEIVFQRLPATLQLGLTAFIISTALGILLGLAAARTRGTWTDGTIRVGAVLGQSMPEFWIGIMAILIFAVHLGWLPTSGRESGLSIIMPAMTLAIFAIASKMRITRSAMLGTLDSEYVKFLRVKGTPEPAVIYKHALRNSLIPVIALTGISVSNLLGGAVIVETVFSWPGMGSLMVEAVNNRDYPLIQAGVIMTSSFLILLNLLIDLSFGLVDPRVRYE